MKTHSRLFLLIGIFALCLPALLLACGEEEPAGSTPAGESRRTEAPATSNGGGGDAGGATPTNAPAATVVSSGTVGVGVIGNVGGRVTEGEFASVSAGASHTCGLRVDGSVACWGLSNIVIPAR